MAGPWEDYQPVATKDFGAPGTTATDIQEGTATEQSVAVKDPKGGKQIGPKSADYKSRGPWEDYTTMAVPWNDYKSETPKQEESSTAAYVGGIIPGAAEAVVGGLVGMGEEAVAGIAGLGTAAVGKGFEKGYEGTKKALAPVSDLMAPETEAGKDISGLLGKIPEAIHAGGEAVFGATNSPVAAAATEAAGTLAAFWLPTKIGDVASAAKKAVLKDAPVPKVIDPSFAKSKIKEGETVSDVISRKQKTDKAATRPSLDEADAAVGEAKLDHLAQTAFRNKETGEIETSGPKHDEAKKAATDETHDQGFIDYKGEFLNRQEALDRARKTGQLPADKDPSVTRSMAAMVSGDGYDQAAMISGKGYEQTGELWSEDLRNAGVSEFQMDRERPEYSKESMEKDIAASIDKEDVAHPSAMKSAAEVIKGSMREIRANDRKADIWGKTIEKLVPEEGLRTRITRAMEAEKETDKLPRQEKVAAAVMKQVQDRFAAIGERATKAGLMDGLRDNYVTHVLDFSKSKMSPAEQQAFLDKIFKAPKDSKLVKDFTAERKYEFLRELEELVKDTGVVVHTDIAKIATAYEKSMLQAEVHKQMTDHFQKTIAPNGKGYIVPLSQEALKEKYVPFQGKGARPLEGLLVHPDIVDEMKFMFEQNDPALFLRALGSVNFLTKTLNTIGSFFHATNLGIAGLTANPALALKEIFTGGSGIRRAVDSFRNDENNELIDGFIRDGLMVKMEDIDRTIIANTGKNVDALLSKFAPVGKEVRAVQHLTEPFDKHALQKINAFTWDYMHAGQKLNLAMNMFTKAKTKNPETPDTQLRQEISKFVNNTFGGLDWLEVADQVKGEYTRGLTMQAANMRGRAWGQIMLFAPDWTLSTLRSFTTALPKELAKPQNWQFREGIKGMYNPKTQGDFARRYVLNTAIGYFTIQNGINMALSGHPIWENKDRTRVDRGDGTTMQVAKHSMESAEWASDPYKTLGNKLGFWPKAAYVAISGRAYPSPDAPKLKDPSSLGKAKAILTTASPFAMSGGVQAPEGEGLTRAFASTMGMPIYGMTKDERAAAIKQGKKDAKEKRKKKKEDEE